MSQSSGLAHPHLRLFHSVGTKLFVSVLGATLVSLGTVSYLFYRALENRAQDEMVSRLRAQVNRVEGQITQTEAYTTAFEVSLQHLKASGVKDANPYQQLSFEFFKKRPDFMMAIGFGQAAYQIVPDRQWLWHYFYVDQGAPEAVGQLLPAPDNNTRYSDLSADDNYPTKDYYTEPVNANKAIWTEPYDWYGITMTSLMAPFYDGQGKLLGVIGSDVNFTAISKLTEQSVLSKGGYFAILSQQGNLLAYPPDPARAEKRLSYQAVPELKAVWQQSQTQPEGLMNYQGNLWAYQRVKGTNWLMLAVVPKKIIFQPALIYMAVSGGGAGIVLLLVVLFYVWKLNRRLKPILAECQVLRIADEQRVTRLRAIDAPLESLTIAQNQDELGILATTVHQLSRQLQQSFALLEKNNEQLEMRVQERTQELAQTLKDLQETQSQLVQNEKMSSLGQMVAGIAHEINNPINFIQGNLTHAKGYTQNLLEAIACYQTHYPAPSPELDQSLKHIELNYITDDLPKLITSMQEGTKRIREIVVSLRNFSRLDNTDRLPVDVHEGIDSTLLILRHRLVAQAHRPEINIIKTYGELPLVACYAGLLNQVFMNLFANAIDVLEEETWEEPRIPTLRISTQVKAGEIVIGIADNGKGMTEATKAQLFNAFFTTKPIGKGTGLGLSISHQVIVEKHGGRLDCISAPGQGTEFLITLPHHTDDPPVGNHATAAVPVTG